MRYTKTTFTALYYFTYTTNIKSLLRLGERKPEIARTLATAQSKQRVGWLTVTVATRRTAVDVAEMQVPGR